MLVLTRRSEESIMIGASIEVRVLGIHGDQVSLGFEAPHDIPIFRKEIFEAIEAENRQAVQRSVDALSALTGSLNKKIRNGVRSRKGGSEK